MPKRKSPGHKSDYIQFRPYHAFASSAPESRSSIIWKLVAGAVALLAIVGAIVYIVLQFR